MRVTADTSILVRALVRDDPHQAVLTDQLLKRASLVVLEQFVSFDRRAGGMLQEQGVAARLLD